MIYYLMIESISLNQNNTYFVKWIDSFWLIVVKMKTLINLDGERTFTEIILWLAHLRFIIIMLYRFYNSAG